MNIDMYADELIAKMKKEANVLVEFFSQTEGIKLTADEMDLVEAGINAGIAGAIKCMNDTFDIVPKVDLAG